MDERWLQELDRPTEGFFSSFAQRTAKNDGAAGATAEAVMHLTPRVDWATYLPHVPHGLLGLRAVWRLRPYLKPSSFLRILATQLHAFAHEGRSPASRRLDLMGKGSGHWGNLRMALETHRSTVAWGEAWTMADLGTEDFHQIGLLVSPDMANVGHKSVMAHHLGNLQTLLGNSPDTGRTLLAMTAWLAASEPSDSFWYQRIHRRLEGPDIRIPTCDPVWSEAEQRELAKDICELGLVALMDRMAECLRSGIGSGDLLAALVLAACEKQLDARRDLEGKTAWNFVYLAALGDFISQDGRPAVWAQAAALINLFPSGEDSDRPRARANSPFSEKSPDELREAILDGEAQRAMDLSVACFEGGEKAMLRPLAEAASLNDPVFNHSHHIMAVAAVADLAPKLPIAIRSAMFAALAKFLANDQGSSDLGRWADRALEGILHSARMGVPSEP